jgi:hypothetical protein
MEKFTAEAGASFLGERALNFAAAEGAGHRPAKPSGVPAAVDSVKRNIS